MVLASAPGSARCGAAPTDEGAVTVGAVGDSALESAKGHGRAPESVPRAAPTGSRHRAVTARADTEVTGRGQQAGVDRPGDGGDKRDFSEIGWATTSATSLQPRDRSDSVTRMTPTVVCGTFKARRSER